MKLDLLKKKSWGRSYFRTAERVCIGAYCVEAGFETDLASVPLPFWWFVNPADPDVAPCAVVHDHMCRTAFTMRQRRFADKFFYNALVDNGVRFRALPMYWGVRLGAYIWGLKRCFGF